MYESAKDPITDPFTGLANGPQLLDSLNQALMRRRLHGGHVVVFHIELNNLGYVHDQLGAHAANAVVKEISHRLLSLLRGEDTVGRRGQNELIVAVSLQEDGAVVHVTERLQAAFEDEIVLRHRSVRMWATFGSVEAENSESATDVLERLDEIIALKMCGTSTAWSPSLDDQ
jgi:diguanylate cyclase (GGDEF)-like protein